MADSGRSSDRSPLKAKVVRSQKILTVASPRPDESDDSIPEIHPGSLSRSHTPGHLATKSSILERRGISSDLSVRHRSQSASTVGPGATGTTTKPPSGLAHGSSSDQLAPKDDGGDSLTSHGKRPMTMRSSSAIGVAQPTAGEGQPVSTTTTATATATAPPQIHRTAMTASRQSTRGYIPFPPLQNPEDAPDVPPAPASGMYWSKALVSGVTIPRLRAHTTTIIGSNLYVFGGCDSRACFNDLYVLDLDSFYWSKPHVVGDVPVPLRAMTCTAVGKKLVIFGGGDGPAYYNDVYVLDTLNFRWSKPRILGDKVLPKRRAHTACLYKNGIYIFGGGDGVRALNDIWRLDVGDTTKMSWKLISRAADKSGSGGPKDVRPKARGYHTANMVGSKLIIFGGSDGGECFDDVWVYDVEQHFWKNVSIPVNFRRLSHTATIVGSYLFVMGGHDGNEYSNDLLLLNLVTMTWDKRKTYGKAPTGRGYHGTVLYDSRLVVTGGFDGNEVFRDVMILELAVHAYYSQISHFTIEV